MGFMHSNPGTSAARTVSVALAADVSSFVNLGGNGSVYMALDVLSVPERRGLALNTSARVK